MYGESLELNFAINEFSVTIEGLEIRATMPISYDPQLSLKVKDSTHLPPQAIRDFNYGSSFSRRLNYVCIIKV